MAKTFWENEGNPTEKNGKQEYAACIDMEDGRGVQRFVGESHKAVADQLLNAQMNATQKINEQRKELRKSKPLEPIAKPTGKGPRVLTADERFTATEELKDPTKAPEAVNRIVEAATGLSLEKIAQRLTKEEQDAEVDFAKAESRAFIEEHDEFPVTPHNGMVLVNWLESKGARVTRGNLEIAFEACSEAGLLQAKPARAEQHEEEEESETEEQRAELPPSTTRPRGSSNTGIRNGDSSAVRVRTPKPMYTRAQIEAMGAKEYKDKLDNEPGFREFVDSLDQPQSRTASR